MEPSCHELQARSFVVGGDQPLHRDGREVGEERAAELADCSRVDALLDKDGKRVRQEDGRGNETDHREPPGRDRDEVEDLQGHRQGHDGRRHKEELPGAAPEYGEHAKGGRGEGKGAHGKEETRRVGKLVLQLEPFEQRERDAVEEGQADGGADV